MRAALAFLACLLAACSTSAPSAAPKSDDAGSEYRALGEPCIASSPHPCEILTEICRAAVCLNGICSVVVIDAGPTCSGGNPPPGPDSGPMEDASAPGDGGSDATVDASIDGSQDAAADSSGEASTDAAVDGD